MKIRSLIFTFVLFTSIFCAYAQDIPVRAAEKGAGVFLGETRALREIPQITNQEMQALKAKADLKLLNRKLRVRHYPYAYRALPKGPDAAWQKSTGIEKEAFNEPPVIFEGQGSPFFPPDCIGTSGPGHFMQMVNST